MCPYSKLKILLIVTTAGVKRCDGMLILDFDRAVAGASLLYI